MSDAGHRQLDIEPVVTQQAAGVTALSLMTRSERRCHQTIAGR